MEQLTFDLLAVDDGPVLCACGCGVPTPPAKNTDRRAGIIKGKPTRYVKGHTWRGRIDDGGRECSACGEYKPWDSFTVRHASIRGHIATCKICLLAKRHTPRTPENERKTKGRADDHGRECTGCHVYKSWDEFHLSAVGFRGHDSVCRQCKSDRRAAYWQADPPPPADDWKPPTAGCASSSGRYTGVVPLQYGIYVYRCWAADDKCIYVGKTRHALRRLGAHARLSWWRDVHHVDVATMTDWTQADAEEIRQIRHWRPVNNSAYNRTFARKSIKPKPDFCPQNHEYTDSNTIYNAKGSKVCRECKNARARAKPKKGIARGERQGSAKLSAAKVADIRRQYALGRTVSALSRDHHVSRRTVARVVSGTTWVHVIREDHNELALPV